MRVYVSVDVEGCGGATQATAEAAAACEGAAEAGASEIVVKATEAMDPEAELSHADLPRGVQLLRASGGHPFWTVQGLDESFDAAVLLGSRGSGTAWRQVVAVRLNGVPLSGGLCTLYTVGSVEVPVVLVTGDQEVCDEVAALSSELQTVPVTWSDSGAVVSMHPGDAVDLIRDAAEADVAEASSAPIFFPPERSVLEVVMASPAQASTCSWYPGAELADPTTVRFAHADWFEVLRALLFLAAP